VSGELALGRLVQIMEFEGIEGGVRVQLDLTIETLREAHFGQNGRGGKCRQSSQRCSRPWRPPCETVRL
jgi:hypothetical protein